jgi:hypothetical protein
VVGLLAGAFVQPSSVPVDRRVRRDGIDSELPLRTLLAWLRGEPRVCSMVPAMRMPDDVFANGPNSFRARRSDQSDRRYSGNAWREPITIRCFGTEVIVWPNCGLLSASHSLQTRMPRSNVCSFGWNWC